MVKMTMIPYTKESAKRDAETAWQAIRLLLPKLDNETLRAALARDHEEAHNIHQSIIDAVIDLAVVRPPKNGFDQPRAYCPLCRRNSSDPYAHGFVYDEGLRRHLEGRGAHKCIVMQALWDMSMMSVRREEDND